MTREEQIKEAGYSADNNLHAQQHPVPGVAEMFNDYFAACFKAGAEWADSHPHWIPVEERLPEPGKNVLVWSSGFDEPMVGCFKHWNWQRKQHMFYVHNDRNMWGNITHWMPMPQPPRKEDKK